VPLGYPFGLKNFFHMFARKEHKQLEFFEELTKSPAKRFKRFKLPSVGEEKIVFKVSYEKIVLVSIVFVLILTLVFSLGVERGKTLRRPEAEEEKISVVEVFQKKESRLKEENVNSEPIGKTKEAGLKSKFYTIQIAAYKDLSRAFEEKKKIEKRGLQAFILKGKKSWILVCVGSFSDISLAKKQLLVLRKTYSDCFIKEIKREDIYNE